MSTVSLKLSDRTKERIARLATKQGTTAHALMVGSIESALDSADDYGLFFEAAVASRNATIKSQRALDGDEFGAYLLAKSRGEKVARPRTQSLRSLAKKQNTSPTDK